MVDDGSTDDTAAIAGARPVACASCVSASAGPAAARNAGVAADDGRRCSRSPTPTASPRPGWLGRGRRGAERRRTSCRAGCVPDPPARRRAVRPHAGVDCRVAVLRDGEPAASRRDAFDRLGRFRGRGCGRARRQGDFGEDVLFGWRARRAGRDTRFAPDALVHHAVFPRGAAGYIAERWRLRFFPALVRADPRAAHRALLRARVPEPRSAALRRRVLGAAWRWRRHPLAARCSRLPYAALDRGPPRADRAGPQNASWWPATRSASPRSARQRRPPGGCFCDARPASEATPGRFQGSSTGEGLRGRAARGTVVNAAFLVGLNLLGLIKGFAVAGVPHVVRLRRVGPADRGRFTTLYGAGPDRRRRQVHPAGRGGPGAGVPAGLHAAADPERAFVVLMCVAMPLYALAYGTWEILLPGWALALAMPASALQAPLWTFYRRMDFLQQRKLQVVGPDRRLVVTIGLRRRRPRLLVARGRHDRAARGRRPLAAVRASPYPLRAALRARHAARVRARSPGR